MLQAIQTTKKKLSKYYTNTNCEVYGNTYTFATVLCLLKNFGTLHQQTGSVN